MMSMAKLLKFGATTLRQTTFSVMALTKWPLLRHLAHLFLLVMMSVVIPSVECFYRYAECRSAECRHAVGRSTFKFYLFTKIFKHRKTG